MDFLARTPASAVAVAKACSATSSICSLPVAERGGQYNAQKEVDTDFRISARGNNVCIPQFVVTTGDARHFPSRTQPFPCCSLGAMSKDPYHHHLHLQNRDFLSFDDSYDRHHGRSWRRIHQTDIIEVRSTSARYANRKSPCFGWHQGGNGFRTATEMDLQCLFVKDICVLPELVPQTSPRLH
eukprot:gb/GECG01013893.1/.p1 GENE.gb/GECG01013893.1/~~gb/GECG01013893.1/.p1  ORF type:complete len:183 (+),score=9.77 gb/GECG01013893.1/:1-549(+)